MIQANLAGAILLYDGDCGVCNGFVRLILARERSPDLRFASLYSDIGRQLLADKGLSPEVESVVLLVGAQPYLYSDAVIGVLGDLRFPWSILRWLALVPRPIRDAGYRIFAKVRRLISFPDSCRLIRPDERDRFLDLK